MQRKLCIRGINHVIERTQNMFREQIPVPQGDHFLSNLIAPLTFNFRQKIVPTFIRKRGNGFSIPVKTTFIKGGGLSYTFLRVVLLFIQFFNFMSPLTFNFGQKVVATFICKRGNGFLIRVKTTFIYYGCLSCFVALS